MAETVEERVIRHYAGRDLERIILDALRASGKDLDRLAPDDLAPVDEFHTGGRQATVELAAQLEITPDMHILDIGCGIGGVARFFAETRGCRVTGIDLSPDYVRTAQALTRRVGLSARVSFRQGSAVRLPFEPGAFDGAYMMHVGMNIQDKARLFAEVRRVLRAAGIFGIYDVMRIGDGELTFPLPCAATPETSFIVSLEEYRRGLESAGFEIRSVRERLRFAREAYRRELAHVTDGGGLPPLGIHLLLKGDAARILANVVDLLDRKVLAPVEIICRAR